MKQKQRMKNEKEIRGKGENSDKYNVLVVGAHPDDAELGCGGTIAKHLERGDNVSVLVLTNGDMGQHHPGMDECKESLEFLGVKKENVFFGNLPDGYIQDNPETVNMIETVINKKNINRIYTHDPNDRHQDHRNASLATSSAARKIGEVLLYQGPSTLPSFEPHYNITLNEKQMKMKLKALSHYVTQIDKGIVNLNLVKYWGGMHGETHGTKYAEAFALNHFSRRGNDV